MKNLHNTAIINGLKSLKERMDQYCKGELNRGNKNCAYAVSLAASSFNPIA
jgi:hypothetical protein